MTAAEKKLVRLILFKNKISLDSDFHRIPGDNMPIASAHRVGGGGTPRPLMVQFNNFDAVFVYELKDELFA